ncbi:MAG: ribonuclease P protein component [Candidatus Levybacteria bacterium]|nr:ribonuclease P protein component [Candidatus Levybacteria bacterium]
MLKKENRLGKVKLIRPYNFNTSLFSLKTAKNNLGINRFAFVVGKKIDKRSTVRNSLRRKVRSCIEEIFDKIEKGRDFVFYPNPKSIEAERNDILFEITILFKKQGFIKND